METEYVYHDAVLLKAALAGSVFSLDVWLYPVYSGLNLNQYGVASPCRTICTVCGFVALS